MPLVGQNKSDTGAERVNLVGCVFGAEKRMKTSSAIAAFPNAIFFGDPDRTRETALVEYGIEPAIWPSGHCQDRLGFDIPEELALRSMELDDVFGSLAWLANDIGPDELAASGVDSFVWDDATNAVSAFLAETEMLMAQGPEACPDAWTTRDGAPVMSSWYHYQQLDRKLQRAIPLARKMRTHFWVTAHEIDPKVDKKTRKLTRGGAAFGSISQCGKVARWLSTVVRTEIDESWIDPYDARAVIRSSWRDRNYIVNDSNRALLDGGPLNIRAAVRASKRALILSRHPGLEWQDDLMLAVADAIGKQVDSHGIESVTLDSMIDMSRRFEAECRTGSDSIIIPDDILELPHCDLYIQWGIQDGLALWWFANEQRRSRRSIVETAPESVKPGKAATSGLPAKKAAGSRAFLGKKKVP